MPIVHLGRNSKIENVEHTLLNTYIYICCSTYIYLKYILSAIRHTHIGATFLLLTLEINLLLQHHFLHCKKKDPCHTQYQVYYYLPIYNTKLYIHSYLLIYKPRTRLLLIVIILLTLLSKIIAKTLTRVALGWVKSRPDRAKSIQGTKLTRAFFRKTQGYLRIKQSAINCCGTIGRHPKI